MTPNESTIAAAERARIRAVYATRAVEAGEELYAPWQPAENLFLSERKRLAAQMLHKVGSFPSRGENCLEVGYGRLGWLADLLSWGLRASDLHGIELDHVRGAVGRESIVGADLRIGDSCELPWSDGFFKLIVVSTVFSSILNTQVRNLIAKEIDRVLVSGGAVLWYDLGIDNPKNRDVRGIGRRELKEMFPNYHCEIRSLTLAPPLARAIAPVSHAAAVVLGLFPFLRTHYLGVFVKR